MTNKRVENIGLGFEKKETIIMKEKALQDEIGIHICWILYGLFQIKTNHDKNSVWHIHMTWMTNATQSQESVHISTAFSDNYQWIADQIGHMTVQSRSFGT